MGTYLEPKVNYPAAWGDLLQASKDLLLEEVQLGGHNVAVHHEMESSAVHVEGASEVG